MQEELLDAVRRFSAKQDELSAVRREVIAVYTEAFRELYELKGHPIRVMASADGDGVALFVYNAPPLDDQQASAEWRACLRRRIRQFEQQVDDLCDNKGPIVLLRLVSIEDTLRFHRDVLDQAFPVDIEKTRWNPQFLPPEEWLGDTPVYVAFFGYDAQGRKTESHDIKALQLYLQQVLLRVSPERWRIAEDDEGLYLQRKEGA